MSGCKRKSQPARGGEARLPTPRPEKKNLISNLVRKKKTRSSPMKKMEERRPVMFMWWEVQEKPVPNCQEAKNPMKAT